MWPCQVPRCCWEPRAQPSHIKAAEEVNGIVIKHFLRRHARGSVRSSERRSRVCGAVCHRTVCCWSPPRPLSSSRLGSLCSVLPAVLAPGCAACCRPAPRSHRVASHPAPSPWNFTAVNEWGWSAAGRLGADLWAEASRGCAPASGTALLTAMLCVPTSLQGQRPQQPCAHVLCVVLMVVTSRSGDTSHANLQRDTQLLSGPGADSDRNNCSALHGISAFLFPVSIPPSPLLRLWATLNDAGCWARLIWQCCSQLPPASCGRAGAPEAWIGAAGLWQRIEFFPCFLFP